MGAPIYLVSACTSGEEFIAAFRRYADKNGLFIPIGEPLPPGRRHRFAVTLRDGGVMIEGEAEIVSSARLPSVLHGRIGMTLRFVEPDDPSRTTLGELERARLSMRPPPPSVPPRPAEVPAEPRPVPPPVQGRIDAVNALAECVAIGDVAALGPPLPPAATPPRAGQRFASPTTPAASRSGTGTSPPGALSVAPRTSTVQRAATAPLPMVLADAAAREADPPTVTPRATPQSDHLRDAADPITGRSQTLPAPPIAPGPSSETMIAAIPPAPSAPPPGTSPMERFDKGPPSSPMSAVPVPTAHPPSAPTEIGGLLVVPITLDDDPSGRTQVHAGAPRPVRSTPPPPIAAAAQRAEAPATAAAPASAPPAPAPASQRAEANEPPELDEPRATTEMRASFLPAVTIAGTAPRFVQAVTITEPRPGFLPAATVTGAEPRFVSAATVTGAEPRFVPAATVTIIEPQPQPGFLPAVTVSGVAPALRPPAPPVHAEVEIAEPTDISMPPEPPSSPSASLAAVPPPTEPRALVEPVEPAPGADAETTSPPVALGDAVPEADAHELAGETDSETEPGASASRPRRTVIGVAVVPSGVGPSGELVPPAPPMLRAPALPAGPDEATTHARIPAPGGEDPGDGSEPGAEVVAPRPPLDSLRIPVEEPTLHMHWDRVAGDAAATLPTQAQTEAASLLAGASGPEGPEGPAVGDGSGGHEAAAGPDALRTVARTEPPEVAVPAASSNLPSGDWTIARDPEAPGGWSSPYQALRRAQADGAPPPLGAVKTPPMSPLAIAVSPSPDDPRAGMMPGLPGEVPVLEPKVQIDPTLVDSLQMPAQPATGAHDAAAHDAPPMHETPSLHMMMAVPQPGPYAPHPGHAMHGPGGALPGYALDAGYPAMPGAMHPGLTPDGSGFGDVRYPVMPSQSRRRGLVILLVTAVVAVLLGIAAMLVFRGHPGAPPSSAPPSAGPPPANPGTNPPPATPPTTNPPPGETAPASATAPPGATAPTAPADGSSAPQSAAAPAAPAAPAAGDCYADVTSQPAGADIVLDQATVVGTTPRRVSLPCGKPVELLVRKARLVPATHTITPTPAGTAVQFVLVRQTFLVKISSTPPGATVTLGGKSLGVTPTMIKVPAFESSTLSIAKDGYDTETEKVAPRANGTAVHSVLKKSERKKPR